MLEKSVLIVSKFRFKRIKLLQVPLRFSGDYMGNNSYIAYIQLRALANFGDNPYRLITAGLLFFTTVNPRETLGRLLIL